MECQIRGCKRTEFYGGEKPWSYCVYHEEKRRAKIRAKFRAQHVETLVNEYFKLHPDQKRTGQ